MASSFQTTGEILMAYKADKLSYFVGQKALVQDISLSVEPGSFAVILGPNGAGKSTMLKLLSGDLTPSSGSVSLEQIALHTFKPERLAKIRAILPQSSNVTFNFSSLDIVLLGRLPYNEPRSASMGVIKEIVQLTRTEYLMEQQFSTLSGGEKQRVQFARILAQIWPGSEDNKDKYLLLDEPTSALDPLYQIEILNIAKWLAKEKGFGVLAILHDLNQTMSYADHLYLLKDGKMEKSGHPQDVLKQNTIQSVWGINTEVIYRNDNSPPVIVPHMN